MGVSGCGKSLSVKAVASCFELPLYRIDMTAVFSGRYGKAESAFVDACRLLEQVAPAVVWFDEIETGMTTHADDPTGELGRIFAFFLTWMQEKPRGLFVAATANRIDLLPAEMIRKGRFDEVFFVDLPLADERTEIFEIHLRTPRHRSGGASAGTADALHRGLDRRRDRAVRDLGADGGAAGRSRRQRRRPAERGDSAGSRCRRP